MVVVTSLPNNRLLAEQARTLFTAQAARVLPSLAQAIGEHLSALEQQAGSSRDRQDRRDALLVYKKSRAAWLQASIEGR